MVNCERKPTVILHGPTTVALRSTGPSLSRCDSAFLSLAPPSGTGTGVCRRCNGCSAVRDLNGDKIAQRLGLV